MKALQFSVTVPQFAALKVLGSMSRRFYYQGPLATIRLVDIPEPTLPSPDWVKLRTFVCGFCGSDVNLILLRDSPTVTHTFSLEDYKGMIEVNLNKPKHRAVKTVVSFPL